MDSISTTMSSSSTGCNELSNIKPSWEIISFITGASLVCGDDAGSPKAFLFSFTLVIFVYQADN